MSFLLKSFVILSFLTCVSLFAYPTYSEVIKEKKIYPLGEKIYKKRCSKIDVLEYKSYTLLLDAINKKQECKTLQKKYKEALALYLWDKKRAAVTQKEYPALKVSHHEKCPICGMFLYKYPRWVSMIEYSNGKKLYFDGLKDLFKYYFKHPQAIKEMLTQEYYTQKTITVKSAYFVIGSDVYGPMGNEFIAFNNEKSARNFLLDHRGKKIVRFADITKEMVYKLDE